MSKKKMKKAQRSKLGPEPEPEPEPIKEPAMDLQPVVEPGPENNEEDSFWGSAVSRKDKKKTTMQMFEPEPEPGKEDGWSLCKSDGKETKPRTV